MAVNRPIALTTGTNGNTILMYDVRDRHSATAKLCKTANSKLQIQTFNQINLVRYSNARKYFIEIRKKIKIKNSLRHKSADSIHSIFLIKSNVLEMSSATNGADIE